MSDELKNKACSECGQPCISRCPCGALVCQCYGFNGPNCSGRHEERCTLAKWNREPNRKQPLVEMLKPPLPIYDIVDVRVSVPRNGKHKSTKSKGKRR